jgi:hypothetical protein
VTVHSGIAHMAIHTHGVTGHIDRLEGRVNAIDQVTAVIDALRARSSSATSPGPHLPAFPRLDVGGNVGGRGDADVLVEQPYVSDRCTVMVDVELEAGIPCLLYGPDVIRGGADEDDAGVLGSEMVTATRVIAVTARDVCQRASALALSTPRADRFRAAAPRVC